MQTPPNFLNPNYSIPKTSKPRVLSFHTFIKLSFQTLITMASTLIKPQNSKNFIGQNYEITLNKSIQSLLDSLKQNQKSSEVFPDFTSIFHQLLQSKIEPPLETIWVYSALAFLHPNSPKIEPLEQFSAIKDLYQLIISCSASCNPLKCIALIAPVIYNLHKFIVDLKGFELGLKREKKLRREIKGLVGSILGYVNVCCEGLDGNHDVFEENLVTPLRDLVSIWIGDRVVENDTDKVGVKEFFPLLSGGTVEGVNFGSCELSELAGFVIAEVFFLKLCVELHEGHSRKEMQNELRCWIVGSITGLRNYNFFWTLLMMLLEPSLPVPSLLDPGTETFLRKILYDAVILPKYSFLAPEKLANLPAKHGKRIALSRLMVIHEAIESLRKLGEDHTKAISYVNAFSDSALPSQLLKWVRSEIGIDVKANGPNGTSPKAFLRWIINLENRGLRIFDDDMSKSRAKLIVDNLVGNSEHRVYEEDGKNSNDDLVFYIDNKGEEEGTNEGDENVNAAFMAAAQTMQPNENARLKRKGKDVGKKKPAKFLKYGGHEDSNVAGERSASSNDDSSSDSEVENPLSDDEEDMDTKEQ